MTTRDDDRGCLFSLAVTIVGLAVGSLAGVAWGWLTFGLIILAAMLIEEMRP